MKKKSILFAITILVFIMNFNFSFAKTDLRYEYEKALEKLKEKGLEVNNYPNGFQAPNKKQGTDAEALFKEKFGDMWENKDLKKPSTNFSKQKNNNFENTYINIFEDSLKSNQEKIEEKKEISIINKKWGISNSEIEKKINEKKILLEEKKQKEINSLNNFGKEKEDETNNKVKQSIENQKKEKKPDKEKDKKNFLSKIFDYFTGKSSIEDMINSQKSKDTAEHIEYYKKYFYKEQGYQTEEQDNQRKKILEVFKKYNIYDRDKNRLKITDKDYIGKLIKDNEDLLRKEIEGFKEFN